MGLLISPAELTNEPEALIFDCRYALLDHEIGRKEFNTAHISGAQYADLELDLSSPAGKGGRHPLPEPDELVARLRNWGVRNDSKVVCYDQNNGAFAARMWWLLRWLGHDGVWVLNGGFEAWLKAGLKTDAEQFVGRTGTFTRQAPLTCSCSADQLPDPELTLVDARDGARFRGEVEPIDPVAGHIPGAICATFTDNMTGGQFKSAEELKQRFETLEIRQSNKIVCYCGSGVTATHNILALMLAGYEEPTLYPGSWSEWVTDPTRPIATD